VLAERALLAALGGSCHSPVAVVCELAGPMLEMRAALLSPDGAERVEGAATFAPGDGDGPARLAADLLARATPGIAAHFTGER
jgi:hydroxymethylbilane synthase